MKFSKKFLAGVTAAGLILGSAGMAGADDISNNIDTTVDATTEVMNLTAGGTAGSTTLRVIETNGDGKNGCNLTGNTTLVASVSSDNAAAATVSPSSVTFSSCDDTKKVTVTPVAAGEATISLTLTANNTAGSFNLAPATFKANVTAPVVVDQNEAPVVTVPDDMNVEGNTVGGALVTFSSTATDAEDETVVPVCSVDSESIASGDFFALGESTVSCTATDSDGASDTKTFRVTVVDTTNPVLSDMPSNQTAVATSSAGAPVEWTAPTATDIVDATPSVYCSPASGSTFALGTTTVSCAATDANLNAAAQTFSVTVQYASTKVLQPINEDGSSKFKLNSTVPVKIKFTGDSAGIGNATITQSVSKLTNAVWGDELEAASTATPHSGNVLRYDATSDQYIFNLATKPLGAGTFRVTLNLGGGKTETAEFSIVK